MNLDVHKLFTPAIGGLHVMVNRNLDFSVRRSVSTNDKIMSSGCRSDRKFSFYSYMYITESSKFPTILV